jgi:hypothetical protein
MLSVDDGRAGAWDVVLQRGEERRLARDGKERIERRHIVLFVCTVEKLAGRIAQRPKAFSRRRS